MNVTQQIFTNAQQAAATLASDISTHELETKRLEAFKDSGFDPVDYTAWLGFFNFKREALLRDAASDATRLAGLATVKAASEQKPATKQSVPATTSAA